MSKQGDDCYFYFYSTCNKGDSCPFRHCEAALGNETICTLWKEGRCFRNVCRFRHMEIDKKRSEIPCFWENQPGGCQKSNCAFHHTKGRYVDGLFLPPSKTTLPSPPESADDDLKAAQITLQQSKLSVQSNPSPQLRGVMKVENSENVPSPTHPPVVINAADDDEDDDDQLSEEGEETKTPVQQPAEENHNGLRIISTRKSNADTKQDDTLNFGIKTLEEIKLKKQKEKTKKQSEGPSGVPAHPLQSRAVPVPEKENVRTVVRTVTLSAKQGEEPVVRLSIAEKPGKRKASVADVSGLPLKRSLAERLGKKIEVDKAPRREKGAKPAAEIHVKTLEEIRLERANQRGESPAAPQAESCCRAEDPSAGGRPPPAGRIKTFSEALAERKHKRLEEEKQKGEELLTEKRAEGERRKQRILPPSVPGKVKLEEPARKIKPLEEVHIKTLEEIKQEKALRMQQSGENVSAAAAQPGPPPAGRKLLRITKLAAPGREEKKAVELSRASPRAVSAPAEPSDQSTPNSKAQVKSLEGTIKEKPQLRQPDKLKKEVAAVPPAAEETVKAKCKASAKPADGKAGAPSKRALKRKAAEISPSAVAAVKPLSSAGSEEPPAKKAALTAAPALPDDSLLTKPGAEKPPSSLELHRGSQADHGEQSEHSSAASASSQSAAKAQQLSSTGAGKAPLSVEDDFEKLIWEISGGKLEAEIDLDPGKDEDDLLLELSEMIDS
ncbi:zinc finger CCCH domain-containing protein 11A isoform X1 [Centrocercus urophasianus]|uniref:zinc finger CCCH domain-containing protein 11A isoform X1 n=1 Tax=Centrocercus urophasianus TaxID=9002 RepID=UPI001C6534B8|nr:zinc finger CCCH domain-containing protein 11A isoform X1 [Centrocercus urophasianus]XP_042692314.1 zinc finger CCCH domain-containing protein 11A isoform X1 [Centrocercus urophasianus]XP_042692315.1 zinc finger CCCH domain-containing protein 11A isoform X1 [Centrocercus urophasianus]XP_042692316.1 zinc finger CCCH domain-containing protein 11A isoform X1 [Centrocercus urophasianus]XP_042692317.1 zinc finger CCCH domain-containing protein 11A isoform X1 [Centrocercus urophasianus]XP_0426923